MIPGKRRWWREYMKAHWLVWVLFILFLVVNSAYLHRVPGLMGDEASEGENVFELWDKKEIPVRGERSYIGPAIDIIRLPFILTLGYTPVALRVPILLAGAASFWLAVAVARRMFGSGAAPFIVAVVFFSPVYLTMQRMGWAITLFPLFALLLIWILLKRHRHVPLLAGVAAGLGLHNHILFMPIIVGIAGAGVLNLAAGAWHNNFWFWMREVGRRLAGWWPAAVGFAAAFGTQVAVLLLYKDDQGDPGEVAATLAERWDGVPAAVLNMVSGSSYIARYTGVEFWPAAQWAVVAGLLVFVGLALFLSSRRQAVALWIIGLLIHLATLLVMVDRFSLRYFFIFALGVWWLAAVGGVEVVQRLARRWGGHFLAIKSFGVALFLSGVFGVAVLVPFMQTGGSVGRFSLGPFSDGAEALVDTRPLLACLRGAGTVSSENVHIFNRLLFFSHEYEDLLVLPEAQFAEASLHVHYRLPDKQEVPAARELCPDLEHFIVERSSRGG